MTDDNNHGLGGARSGKLGHGVPGAPDAHNILALAGGVHIKDLFAPVLEDGDDDALAAWERLADLHLAITSVGGSPTRGFAETSAGSGSRFASAQTVAS